VSSPEVFSQSAPFATQDPDGESGALTGGVLSRSGTIAISVGIVALIVVAVAIAVVLWRRSRPIDGRDNEVFGDLYVAVDSTFDNPLMTEQGNCFDDVFKGELDESLI
jgi:hypothetical protein